MLTFNRFRVFGGQASHQTSFAVDWIIQSSRVGEQIRKGSWVFALSFKPCKFLAPIHNLPFDSC